MGDREFFAVGGLGGSGTRVVAQIFQRLGFYPGPRLNRAQDCLLFTLLFKRPAWFKALPPEAEIRRAVEMFVAAMTGGLEAQVPCLGADALENLIAEIEQCRLAIGVSADDVAAMRATPAPDIESYAGLAWKEPNTHVFLPWLAAFLPGLRYVHVIRHGLDMALSRNRLQLAYWGRFFDVKPEPGERIEQTQLRFWAVANRRAIEFGHRHMGARFLLLRHDDLCRDPDGEIARLTMFAGQEPCDAVHAELRGMIDPIVRNRYRDAPDGFFNESDRETVRRFGFEAK